MAKHAQLDERRLMPAWRRYDGSLHKAAQRVLSQISQGAQASHLVIVSGGYGLLLANEPIGTYDARFKARDWPRGLLEEALVEYARSLRVQKVRAIASYTTDYARLIREAQWEKAGVSDAWLFTPESVRAALRFAPRAQSEALDALVSGRLYPDWRSSDGLRLRAVRLVAG